MKTWMLLVSACMFSVIVLGQSQNSRVKYVAVNEKIKEEIIGKIVKSFDPDKKDEIFYKQMLSDAFDSYFAHKKVKATVYGQDTINFLNRQLAERNSELKQLSKGDVEQRLNDVVSIWRQKCDSLQTIESGQNDTITHLREQLAYAQSNLQTIHQSMSVLENIMEQLKEKQMAIDSVFANCINSQLVNISDIPHIQSTIVSYKDFLAILKQPIPKEQMAQIEIVDIICSAAMFCQAAKSELSKKYNRQEVNSLVSRSRTIEKNLGKLKPMQQTEFSQIVHVLKNEEFVVLNFMNGVIATLSEEGCIPDANAIENALNIISNYISLITNGDPNCDGGYNAHYVYLNHKLEQLRSDIKQSRKNGFDNEIKFRSYLSSLRNSLSE